MKVTFVQPPSALLLSDKVMPPLGILMLGAWLREHGHEVSVIDLAGVDDWKQHLQKEKKKLETDWIGFSCTTPQYGVSQKIRDYIWNEMGFSIPVVVGNIHITSEVYANRMDFLENDGFSSYCTGEGFNAVTKMCDDLKQEGQLKKLYSEPIVRDVDTIPFAARDLIDISSYTYKLGTQQCATLYDQWSCYYSCSYCESRMNGSNIVRMMSPQRIYSEIKHIIETYKGMDGKPIKAFMHFSDELNLNRDRLLGICEKYKQLRREYGDDVIWRGFLVAAKTDDEVFRAMKESGCYECASGIESFSPKILKTIKKPATVDMNLQFIRKAKKAGLRMKAFMIMGLPGCDWTTVREDDKTLSMLKQEGNLPDDIDISILQVYHGSGIYNDKVKDPSSIDIEFKEYDYDKMYYKSSPDQYNVQVRTKGMSEYDLKAARNYLEYKYKKANWLEDYTGRKDLDRVMYNEDVMESIKYAEKKLSSL